MLAAALVAFSLTPAGAAQVLNGFDLSNASIPEREIRRGGPPRDGIPAILDPKFVSVRDAYYMRDRDQVIGFVADGVARAYPLRILVWHEIVNDTVAGQPIAVTYCPLCGTAMIFSREAGDVVRTFGVSGLLYNSDVLMYDHQSESLWSQLMTEAVAGPAVGTPLGWLGGQQMTWAAWRERYPDSEVLSTETGHRRNYDNLPYQGYEEQESTFFPFEKNRSDLPNKEWVIGIVVNGRAKAYPIKALDRLEAEALRDTVGGAPIRLTWDRTAQWAQIERDDTGEDIPSTRAYWFAWQAFYGDTALYRP